MGGGATPDRAGATETVQLGTWELPGANIHKPHRTDYRGFTLGGIKVSLNSFTRSAGNQWLECMPLFVWLGQVIRADKVPPCNDMCPNYWSQGPPLIYLFSSTLTLSVLCARIRIPAGHFRVYFWIEATPRRIILFKFSNRTNISQDNHKNVNQCQITFSNQHYPLILVGLSLKS